MRTAKTGPDLRLVDGDQCELQIKMSESSEIEIEGVLEKFCDDFYNGR